MPGTTKGKKSNLSRQSNRTRPVLQPLKEQSQGMELEYSPYKDTRRRASTMGYDSPNPKDTMSKLNDRTYDTSSRINSTLERPSDISQLSADIHLSNTLARLRQQKLPGFLNRHQVQEKFRARMMDWMLEVLNTFQQKESTIYRAMYLLDYFYYRSEEEETLDNLHITGMACMMIASKCEEINFIKVDAFLDVVGKGKFTKEDLLNREMKVLEVLKFKTAGPTIFEAIRCSLTLLDISDPTVRGFVEKSSLLLSKMCLFSYQLVCSLEYHEIALYCIIISLKISEKLRSFNAAPEIKKLLLYYSINESPVFAQKVQIVHSFTVEFPNIMPYVKNLSKFYSFA